MNDSASPLPRILYIAGTPDEERSIMLRLEQDGLKVDFQKVDNEKDFIAALDQTPDLILSDLSLPHFDNVQALHTAQKHKADVPVILISENADEDMIVGTLNQGAYDHLTHANLSRLPAIIRRTLEYKRLTRNEERYRSLFEHSTIALWEEDFSEVKAEVDKLRENGVTDFRSYIKEHPDFLERSLKMVNILDANEAMLRLYHAKDKADVLGSIDRLADPSDFEEELISFAEGKPFFEREIYRQTLQGKPIHLLLTLTYYSTATGKHKALVHLTDITARKKADENLRSQNEYLALLNEMTRTILLSSDYDTTMQALASNMKKIIDADDCYILRWDEEQQKSIPVTTTAKLDFPFRESGNTGDLSITASILQAGRVVAIEDVLNSPYVNVEVAKRYPAHSILGIPLIAGNQPIGVAIIAFNSHHSFIDDEITRAEQAGNQVALAIWNFQQNLEIQHRLDESNTLAEIGRALSETERVGTDKVLQLIVNSARDLIQHAEESIIHFIGTEEDVLIPRAISGFDAGVKAVDRPKMRLREGVSGHVINTGETVNIGDIGTSPLYVVKESSPTYRSLLVVPVQSGGKPSGTISVQSNKLNAFSERDVELLNSLGIQASIAIENTRLFEATQQSLRETNALYRTIQGLASSYTTDELIDDVVNLLQQNFEYYHVQIYLVDPDTGDAVLKSGSGEIGIRMLDAKTRLEQGTGIVNHVLETGLPFVANNVNEIVFFYRNPLLPDTQSEMTVPIMLDNKAAGVIDIQEKPPNKLTNNDMQLMIAVADQLSVALQRARLYTELQSALQQEQTIRSQLMQSERLALVGRLLASVSHELNNPLQAIQNALFLLKDEEQLSAQGKQDLDVILSEAERMASLIERLRSAYRPGRSRDFRPVELNNLIEDVHTLITTHMRQKQIVFEFHPQPDLPPISGMPDQIRQVVLNLFINAVEVMEAGGRLTVRTEGLIQQNEVLFSVKDTGPGIDPDILPQIFDAFITSKLTGTGLGLTITRDIIEQHFGRIKVNNDPEGGAIFKIWLPMHKEKGSD